MISISPSEYSKLKNMFLRFVPRLLRPTFRLILSILLRSDILKIMIPRAKPIGSFDGFSPNKQTVLITNHEASRTGAPIVGYNLMLELSKKYNVVLLFLAPGTLLKENYPPGVVVLGPLFFQASNYISSLEIRFILKRTKVRFAIVNSIESRFVLDELVSQNVPVVALIHEFMANTIPKSAYFYVSSKVKSIVFSSQVTLDDATSKFPSISEKKYSIIPQGLCVLPDSRSDKANIAAERSKISKLIRPKNFPKDGLVVIGAGSVNYRKGVDLFINCAARMLQRSANKNIRFVWVGKGFEPEIDTNYSVYLADQLAREGLSDSFLFLGEVISLETVYANADIFLLTSRLDPLPNVAIDAFFSRLPLLCFDGATGIAEILTSNGLRDLCVVDYLDINEMALKALALAESSDLRLKVLDGYSKFASSTFNMVNYAGQIESLGLAESERISQIKSDARMIFESKMIDWDYYQSPLSKRIEKKVELVENYVKSWALGNRSRKLFSGFHPDVYFEKHGVTVINSDPVADFIRNGMPKGEWAFELIEPEQKFNYRPLSSRIALHIHVYYIELLPQIMEGLKSNQTKMDLLISVVSEPAREHVEKALSNYDQGRIYVRVVPNKGRDIGPFLTEFGELIQKKYDIVGHLHTKKSLDFHDKRAGKVWLNFLLGNLLGNSKIPMADIILNRMDDDESIGMVFPDDPNLIGWSANKQIAHEIAGRMRIEHLPNHFNFPVGTMFWARVSALTSLFELDFSWDDYPNEPLAYDGTVLHAIERLLSILVVSNGYRIELTHVNSLTR